MSVRNSLKIALIGNPNSGKSSLFNQLTGLNQKVGNFPGVTVDKKVGYCQLTDTVRAEIIDLPGTYSLYPKSLDEKVIIDLLYDKRSAHYPDLIIVTADASNLKRNLLLFTQLADLRLPAVLALNMMDVAEKDGIKIDLNQLQESLGVPVIPMNARKGIGVAALKIVIAKELGLPQRQFFSQNGHTPEAVKQIRQLFHLDTDYLALHYAHQFRKLRFLSDTDKQNIERILQSAGFDSTELQAAETISRYTAINELLLDAVRVERVQENEQTSNRLDHILTHKVWGYLIFFGILLLIFQAIFTWATYPMDLIDAGIASLSEWIRARASGPLIDLLTNGVLAGLGGVLIFIPQIAILFAFIAILEETGYMARVTFMFDKIMRKFGLNGKSLVPLISGAACAVPAVMSARTIENWKDRLITIFVTPLMSCSARIPVYTVLIALVIPSRQVLGVFNLQALALMGLYLLGLGTALLTAMAMKYLMKTRERSFFIMELPVYKMPRWKNVGLTILEKVKAFVFEAGKVILAISIVLWVLASYGPSARMEAAEKQATQQAQAQQLNEAETEQLVESVKLENSYAGLFGKTLEPVIRPLGYDWKIGIALITSFAAREVFVGTMSTIYSIGQDESISTIQQKLAAVKTPSGAPFFNLARGLSLLVFYVFAMQCMSTLAVVRRETKSWKWPLLQLVYMTGLAYVCAFVVYQLF